MGKISRRLVARTASISTSTIVDSWLIRAAHLSQMLLLVLGVFGYFYTVLPVYQKSLLDEEIAQKALEIKAQEKRIADLNAQIQTKVADLNDKDRQITLARSNERNAQTLAKSAKAEAEDNYRKLRIEYLLSALAIFRNCPSPFYKKVIDGSELSSCTEHATSKASYYLSNLSQNDAQHFKIFLKKKVDASDTKFHVLLDDYRQKIAVAQSDIESLEKQSSELKAGSGSSQIKPLNYFSESLELSFKLQSALQAETNTRAESNRRFRKILEEISKEMTSAF